MSSYSFLFKFIIIGDSSVGKSCLLLQFHEHKFKNDHDTTIGVEFASKLITCDDRNIKLQIWDTAGQESFKSITRSYYRGSICGIVVYDTTNRDSFDNISRWIDETKHYANDKITLVLVGNKTDIVDKRQVTYEQGKRLAEEHGLLFLETSAKTGENVERVFNNKLNKKVFQSASEEVLNKIEKNEIDPTNEAIGIRIGSQLTEKMMLNQTQTKQKQKGCC